MELVSEKKIKACQDCKYYSFDNFGFSVMKDLCLHEKSRYFSNYNFVTGHEVYKYMSCYEFRNNEFSHENYCGVRAKYFEEKVKDKEDKNKSSEADEASRIIGRTEDSYDTASNILRGRELFKPKNK